MRRSSRLAKKQTKLGNEVQKKPKAKKSRSDNKISSIAPVNNDTTVEVFKFLNYMQLAKSSLVSKRFSTLIRIHRHSLALLNVASMSMKFIEETDPAYINMFGKYLSPEEYNEWATRNTYLKQIPFETQVVWKQNIYGPTIYELNAVTDLKDQDDCRFCVRAPIFFARAKLNDENWPLFQHFIRLLSDPFIYIGYMELTPHNDVTSSLVRAINPDRTRLQCRKLRFNLESNCQKFICWIKDNLLCDEIQIIHDDGRISLDYTLRNNDEKLLDFFLTGARCTSKFNLKYCEPYKVIVDFVQRFMDLKSCDECQVVESIECILEDESVEKLWREYAKFIVKEEKWEFDDIDFYSEFDRITGIHFEFVNVVIGKKLQLTVKIDNGVGLLHFNLYNQKIDDL